METKQLDSLNTFDRPPVGQPLLVQELQRLKLQLQIVEARVREITPGHADLISDLADEAEGIIQRLRRDF